MSNIISEWAEKNLGRDALAELVGKTLPFYGVDNLCFKLGDAVYEAVEDESDGYRSYLGTVRELGVTRGIFFGAPLAHVTVEEYRHETLNPFGADSYYRDGWYGYVLRDDTGHVWLAIGTDHCDDCYPVFEFTYNPRRDQTTFAAPTASDFGG